MSTRLTATLAIGAAAASLAAIAADYAWSGDAAYTLEASDTLTFAESATIGSGASFSGAGTIDVNGGTLSLAYERPTADKHPFKDFTGTLVLEQGTSMDAGFKLHNENANSYEYGLGENMTLAMKGAKITRLSSGKGNDGTNNDTLPWLQLEGDNFIVNGTDRNGDSAGVNIRFGKGIKGTGNLTITSKSRSVTLKGSNAGFSGTLTVAGDAGKDPNGLWFEGHATASADAAFVHTRPEYVYFQHNNDDDKVFRLGALVANGDTAGIDVTDAGTTLSIGSKAGTDSLVTVPFVKSAVAKRLAKGRPSRSAKA